MIQLLIVFFFFPHYTSDLCLYDLLFSFFHIFLKFSHLGLSWRIGVAGHTILIYRDASAHRHTLIFPVEILVDNILSISFFLSI